MIFNLLKNSLYYLNSNPNEYVKIYVKRGEKSNYNQLIVEDNGLGIPADKIKHIFDSFYTSGKKEGTGLGLDFCKKTMDGFGGKIECESEVKKFTRFILSFPKVDNMEVKKLLPKRLKSNFDDFAKNILIVEEGKYLQNLPIFRDEITDKLKINSTFISKEKEAVKELKSHYNYDLLLIDFEVKKFAIADLIEKIRKFHGEIPIVIFNADKNHSENYLALGADEIIEKNDKSEFRIIRSITKWNLIGKLPENCDYPSSNKKPKRILLAEDEMVNKMLLSNILKKSGFEVDLASDGQELYDKFFDKKSKYDVIITDVNMPVMNGDEVAKKIRKSKGKNSQIPIIVYSGDGEKEKIHKFLRCGMNDFFVKGSNVNLSDLVNFWTN